MSSQKNNFKESTCFAIMQELSKVEGKTLTIDKLMTLTNKTKNSLVATASCKSYNSYLQYNKVAKQGDKILQEASITLTSEGLDKYNKENN